MSNEPRTRHIGVDELTRVLAELAEVDPVAARPIQIARDAPEAKDEPATKLGVGAPRSFDTRACKRAGALPKPEQRPPPARPCVPARPSVLPRAPVAERALRAWHAWL